MTVSPTAIGTGLPEPNQHHAPVEDVPWLAEIPCSEPGGSARFYWNAYRSSVTTRLSGLTACTEALAVPDVGEHVFELSAGDQQRCDHSSFINERMARKDQAYFVGMRGL